MEQPLTYAWRCSSSPWRDYKYNRSTSNAEEEEEHEIFIVIDIILRL